MIKGVHTMFYSSEVEELRLFIRDKLGFSATDVGGGWLIFDIPEADMGCHPVQVVRGVTPDKQLNDGSASQNLTSPDPKSGDHYISFYCEDIQVTVKELGDRGVEFIDEITDVGYGLAIHFVMPGGVSVELYQPAY